MVGLSEVDSHGPGSDGQQEHRRRRVLSKRLQVEETRGARSWAGRKIDSSEKHTRGMSNFLSTTQTRGVGVGIAAHNLEHCLCTLEPISLVQERPFSRWCGSLAKRAEN